MHERPRKKRQIEEENRANRKRKRINLGFPFQTATKRNGRKGRSHLINSPRKKKTSQEKR